MDAYSTCRYKEFDAYPLVCLFDPPHEWHERRLDRSYSASVLICQEGEPPNTECSRISPLPVTQWDNIGTAKHAVAEMVEDIIDSLVSGRSVHSQQLHLLT